jgi:hypothetical protein
MFSTADFVDSFVGHADPWKQQWFLSRFSTSNCTFDDMPQGVSGAIKKRGGFRPFRELGRVGSRRNRMEIPRRKIPSDLEFSQARWCFARQSTRHTLQAIQVVVGYSGWRLLDGPTPQRGGGIAGSCNETRWLYAPRGRKGIAQGKAKRRPGIGVPETTQALKGRNRRRVNRCAHVSPFQGFGELGRRLTQGDRVRPRVALRSTLGYLIMPRWGERSGYGSVLIAHCRRPKLRWVIKDGVCPMVLCPNGAVGDSPGQSEALVVPSIADRCIEEAFEASCGGVDPQFREDFARDVSKHRQMSTARRA